jgi:four helix bundle protein
LLPETKNQQEETIMGSRSYRDLEVWQKAMDLVVDCYRITQDFPKSETYGLVSQLQRAAVSIPANIAEGQGRQHLGEFLQFLSIAGGSLAELETHLLIAYRLGYITQATQEKLFIQSERVGKMLAGLRKSLSQV